MRSFYQDRLGTNIGKTQKRVAFFAGFARGQRCQDNPAPGQPGYSQPDHSFTAAAAARPAAGGGGDGGSGDESQYLSLVLAVLGGVALTGLGAFAVVKMGFVSVVPTGASQSLLSDDAQSAQQQQQAAQQAAQQGGESSMYDEDVDMGLD